MGNIKPIQTLVECIRKTGWWPSDVPSSLDGKARGEVVVLDTIAFVDFDHLQWEIRSRETDSQSLPVPFTRSELHFVAASDRPAFRWPWQKPKTRGPKHVYVLVADAADPKNINPLTDCCALVPFDEMNLDLSPSERVELAKHAIAAFLSGLGAAGPFHPVKKTKPGTHPPTTLAEELRASGFPVPVIALREVGPATICSSAWLSQQLHEAPEKSETLLGRSAKMFELAHMPTGSAFMVTIIAVDLQHIDPVTECVAHYEDAVKGADMAALGREAIIFQLHSIGAWPHPVTEIPMTREQAEKAANLNLKLAVGEVLSKLEEMKAGWPQYSDVLKTIEASVDITALQQLHAYLESGKFDVSPAARATLVGSVFDRLEKLEHRMEQFEKITPKMVAQLQDQHTDVRAVLRVQFDFQCAIDAFLFMMDEIKPRWPPVVIEDIESRVREEAGDVRSLLSRLETGEIDALAEGRTAALVSVLRGLEGMESLDERGWQWPRQA